MTSLLLAAALVWIPPETFTHWSRVDGLLRERPGMKLTIALTPGMATPLAKDALRPWIRSGRVEIAARVPGDPVLPLVAAEPSVPRPDDALEPTAAALRAVERRFGVRSAGFVPGAGAMDASLAGPIGASGAAWILAGPYSVAGDSWAAEDSAVFVPARLVTPQNPWSADASGAFVVDESSRTESAFLGEMGASSSPRPVRGWATVSELLASHPSRAPTKDVARWPEWSGLPTSAPVDPPARAAYDAYLEAAKALARYQNSGAADLRTLERATALLRKAQDARFFRLSETGTLGGLPPDLRARLLAVYRKIDVAAPDSLYAVASSSAAAELPTGLHAVSGSTWISFENPLGTLALAPAGVPNADPWRLRGLRVEWDDRRILFRVLTARVDAPPAAPRPVYDIYIDLNRIVGAGAIRLLDGRGAFAPARDAWEFALSVSGTDAHLFRARPEGGAEEVAPADVELDTAAAEIRVAVSRDALRGNPARWGYILLALAEDPANPGQSPAAVLAGADGTRVLGLLGSLESQKAVLERPGTPQRVPAARLDATQDSP